MTDLKLLPSLPYELRHELPDVSAVYIVAQDGKALYVGSTVNLRKRWINHHRARLIEPESNTVIAWRTVDVIALRTTETDYVKVLQLAWNSRYIQPVRPAHRLGEVLRCYRICENLSTRELALDIGIPRGTLSRIEHGRSMDGQSFVKVLAWLFADEAKNESRTKEQR